MAYLAAALIILWLLVAVYVTFLVRSQRRLEQELSILAESVQEQEADLPKQ